MIKLIRKFYKRTKNLQVISYPKSGRTWLTVMVGEYLKRVFDLKIDDIMDIHNYSQSLDNLPSIHFGHDDQPLWKKPYELKMDKSKFKNDKVILLIREPKDVLVSAYFERTKRYPKYRPDLPMFEGSISKYIRQDVGGIDTIIEFNNNWYNNKSVPSDFRYYRYEDLIQNTHEVLSNILMFIGIEQIDETILHEVVVATEFKNMQKQEGKMLFKSVYLQPGDMTDQESYKVRKGKIGGYIDYLNEEDIIFLDSRIKNSMNPIFGY